MLGHISRRTFLWLTGGSGAAILFNPARQFVEKLIPYVNPPQYPKPGSWAFYATTCRECPAGCGMLLWHRDGRVTKAEGNPLHPISKGKLCIRGQSSVQGQYDPDRLKSVFVKNGTGQHEKTEWIDALESIRSAISKSDKVRVLSDIQTGSLARTMEKFSDKFGTKPIYYEAFNYEAIRKANKQTYGLDRIPRYNIADSDLVISFGANLLETWISPIEYARNFGKIHSLIKNKIGKYVYLGNSETMSASNADRFLNLEPGKEANIMHLIAEKLAEKGAIRKPKLKKFINPKHSLKNLDESTIEELANMIMKAKKPIILAGSPFDNSPEAVEAVKAASLLNELLGNQDKIDFAQYHALSNAAYKKDVHEAIQSLGSNDLLIVHKTNPVFTEPALKEKIKQVGKVIYIGTMMNETAQLADWVLPANSSLEDWGDYEPWKGTLSLMQPTMRPLFETRSAGDIFTQLSSESMADYKTKARNYWQEWFLANVLSVKPGKKEKTQLRYDKALKSASIEATPKSKSADFRYPASSGSMTKRKKNAFFLQVLPSLYLYDGRLANRPWLQEIPHPITNIVFQSWADMNREKAKTMGIEDGEMIKISSSNGSIKVPVRLTNKINVSTIAIEAGQGHWAMGKTAKGTGVNVFSLVNNASENGLSTVKIEKTGHIETPLYLHPTKNQHDREILRHVDLDDLQSGAVKKEKINLPLPEGYHKDHDLYKSHEHKDHRWAMVIDIQKCIGCKACEAACYAENNIPTVGRKNLEEGREMSWLKVVPYKIDEERTAYLPLPCQHCDAAPCEPVCPVFASVHTEEGLNAQIYNRCIGTRYCSNNCPYKVRRFNWVKVKREYPTNLQLNPDVTVRNHGVMEKCTFCVQRIRSVEHKAKKEQRDIEDQEIQPACAQTCPTNAIVFGDLMDENSLVRHMINDTRRYQLLGQLNTKPAVIYLKKITIKT
jgi:molybdopterin-containing oxidoreductase family iron-sulfur binding subunit